MLQNNTRNPQVQRPWSYGYSTILFYLRMRETSEVIIIITHDENCHLRKCTNEHKSEL